MKEIEKKIKESSKTKELVSKNPIAHGVGRRKSSVARVWLRHGNGAIKINNKSFDAYCTTDLAKEKVVCPLKLLEVSKSFSVQVNVFGGGIHSQADAIKLGIARALLSHNESYKKILKENGLLTVDDRIKERKKYGQKGARAKFQFVKR